MVSGGTLGLVAASLTCCEITMLSGVEGGVKGDDGPGTPTFRFLCMGLAKTGDWREPDETGEVVRSKFCLPEC